MDYIVIDSGTTNTRIRYVCNNKIVVSIKEQIGAKDVAITKDKTWLRTCIQVSIYKCLKLAGKDMDDVEAIIAYGMITSESGLVEITHRISPVNNLELKKNIVKLDLIDLPIYFIPGVKNNSNNILEIDIMRGEETEVFGLIKERNLSNEFIYISPGSHAKFVFVDHSQWIVKCSSTMSGELIDAVVNNTIVAKSLPSNLLVDLDEEYINMGIEYCKKYGFTKACMQIRILDIMGDTTYSQRMNFYVAVICYYDIYSVRDMIGDNDIFIGGIEIIGEFYKLVFELMGYKNYIEVLNKEEVDSIGTLGAINIYECNE